MIEVHRLNGEQFWINHNLIEIMEETPDTVLRLTNEIRYVVKESIEEIMKKITHYNEGIFVFRNQLKIKSQDTS